MMKNRIHRASWIKEKRQAEEKERYPDSNLQRFFTKNRIKEFILHPIGHKENPNQKNWDRVEKGFPNLQRRRKMTPIRYEGGEYLITGAIIGDFPRGRR